MAKSPCKGCRFRVVRPNCHTSCEAYIAYKEKQAEENETRRSYNVIAAYVKHVNKKKRERR